MVDNERIKKPEEKSEIAKTSQDERDFEEDMAIAEKVMREEYEVLRKLADS